MGYVELSWDPFDLTDPGPLIDVTIMNSSDVMEEQAALGFEYRKPRPIKALLDTGASITVVSKAFATYCSLFQTSEETAIAAVGTMHSGGDHAGSVSFPGTDLRPFDPIRIVSVDFPQERRHACLIGRDILRSWNITFDGRSKRVIIRD